MLFETPRFALFALVCMLAFHVAPAKSRRPLLAALSLAYAATFSLAGVAVLLAEAVVAWFFSTRIRARSDDAPRLRNVALALVLLMGTLALFKYAAPLSASLGVSVAAIAIPVGISYYTFKLAGLVIDTHWDKVDRQPTLLEVIEYAAFFPQLLTGPIQRPQAFFSQARATEPPTAAELTAGMRLILIGLFKKVVVADRAGLFVDQVYARPHVHAAATVAAACYLYALQLYIDFSGYTDIALGLGRLFGIKGPPNFALPYLAPTVQEFWRRWHMSLSSWLSDYVFTPLRMTLRSWGNAGLAIALAATMIAIGIWHGARWTFAAFGALNALYIVGSALTLKARDKVFGKRPGLARARRIWQPLIVFHLMVVAFVFFRAQTLETAWAVLRAGALGAVQLPSALLHRTVAATIEGWSALQWAIVLGGTAAVEVLHHLQSRERLDAVLDAKPRAVRWALYYGLVAAVALFGLQGARGNIYFKF